MTEMSEFSELTIGKNRFRSNICSHTTHNVAGCYTGSESPFYRAPSNPYFSRYLNFC